ncbi:F0F1 ATP synthase subunit A [Entomobacter blattae]|uniref:ATP synthase subunit a n=1 Tax=Entomobacter blattae TaxID=2762277 RepID=A0A7H1NPQ8_9PROT|nr:F0F1 ATP synthase subunit A [Entomobacter blattae]QNT77768.1 ATP synthase subunit a [Entomobacter blattae]
MAEGSSIDALGQFELHPVFGSVGEALKFSQSSLMMVVTAVIVAGFILISMVPRSLIPGRLQATTELGYNFIHNMTLGTIGDRGKAYFPFIYTLFFFILIGNYLGLMPWGFAFTSHIVVTVTLALLVFFLAMAVSFRHQGMGFFAHFLPEGAPIVMAPLLVPIEILSYLSRPVSLSIRLFANMVAGHVMFIMFATFTIMFSSLGLFGDLLGVAPIVINIALMALELLVGALQAYVFAILACIYLQEAVGHGHHD